jgi:hypothetical protein
MDVIIMKLHSSWECVVLIELQLSYNKLQSIYNGLQVFDATQKLSCKASCKTPLKRLFIKWMINTLYNIFPFSFGKKC